MMPCVWSQCTRILTFAAVVELQGRERAANVASKHAGCTLAPAQVEPRTHGRLHQPLGASPDADPKVGDACRGELEEKLVLAPGW